jgi:hypothetical protein
MTISICAYLLKKGLIDENIFVGSMVFQFLETIIVVTGLITLFGND